MCQELGHFSMVRTYCFHAASFLSSAWLNFLKQVMEFLSGGSLDGFLQELNDEGQEMPSVQLFQIVFGIVRGMAHLAASRVVHRDLAARNILLDGDHIQPRISDFGFSRVVGDEGEGKTNATGSLFSRWTMLDQQPTLSLLLSGTYSLDESGEHC
jgi:serine/threonine protein kinase